MRKINKIIIHHSQTPGGNVEFLRNVHVKDNGWTDVGYHYVITNGIPHGNWPAGMDGFVQDGRPVEMVGAHAKGANQDSIGICLIGDFENNQPTRKQIASLTSLLIELCNEYDITPFGNILGHRDANNTDCPGRYLYSFLMPLKVFLEAVMWGKD
jgi:N-acetyl-anhydromuramyl-L-alanine amidase AmpD